MHLGYFDEMLVIIFYDYYYILDKTARYLYSTPTKQIFCFFNTVEVLYVYMH